MKSHLYIYIYTTKRAHDFREQPIHEGLWLEGRCYGKGGGFSTTSRQLHALKCERNFDLTQRILSTFIRDMNPNHITKPSHRSSTLHHTGTQHPLGKEARFAWAARINLIPNAKP